MSQKAEFCAVLCSFPDKNLAEKMARILIEKRLGACAQIWGQVTSIYRWESKIENEAENILWIKTKQDQFLEIQKEILALHPFKVPQIVSIPIQDGFPPYLEWINKEVQK